jgi:hypothetical protein
VHKAWQKGWQLEMQLRPYNLAPMEAWMAGWAAIFRLLRAKRVSDAVFGVTH